MRASETSKPSPSPGGPFPAPGPATVPAAGAGAAGAWTFARGLQVEARRGFQAIAGPVPTRAGGAGAAEGRRSPPGKRNLERAAQTRRASADCSGVGAARAGCWSQRGARPPVRLPSPGLDADKRPRTLRRPGSAVQGPQPSAVPGWTWGKHPAARWELTVIFFPRRIFKPAGNH